MKLPGLLFAALLSLYPKDFRHEFAAEMQGVFTERMQEARKLGWLAFLWVMLGELAALPSARLRQLWEQFEVWLAPLQGEPAPASFDLAAPGSWTNSILAGLPTLLYALALYFPILTGDLFGMTGRMRHNMSVFWALAILMLLIAARLGWPRWSASWIGYGLVCLLNLSREWLSSGWQALLANFVWLVIAILVIYTLVRRDWVASLLAGMPVTTLWIWLERAGDLPDTLDAAALYLSISMIVTTGMAAIVRLGRWQTAVLILMAVLLASGLPDSYGRFQTGAIGWHHLPGPAPWYGPEGWMAGYTLVVVFTAPLWLLALWKQIQQRQVKVNGKKESLRA